MLIGTIKPRNRVHAVWLTWPDALHIRGSVIRISFPPVLVMTGYGVGIAFLIRDHPKLAVNLSIMTPVAVVLSLLLVFRTNSAYDRFWEGRKLWQDLMVTSRNLVRSVWCSVADKTAEDRQHKRQALKDVVAFVIAIKHYLRGEEGIEHADFEGLLSPELRVRMVSNGVMGDYGALDDNGAGRNSPAQRATSHASLYIRDQQQQQQQQQQSQAQNDASWMRDTMAPLPMQLVYELQKYMEYAQGHGLLTVQMYAGLLNQVNALCGLMGGCERIVSTPIPLAYHIHLHHSLYLYLLILPWALGSMGLAQTIILQAIISFMMIGIDAISREIQNPFGYDHNDLPLDVFCESLLVDLNYALRHRGPKDQTSAEDTLSNGASQSKTTVAAPAPVAA